MPPARRADDAPASGPSAVTVPSAVYQVGPLLGRVHAAEDQHGIVVDIHHRADLQPLGGQRVAVGEEPIRVGLDLDGEQSLAPPSGGAGHHVDPVGTADLAFLDRSGRIRKGEDQLPLLAPVHEQRRAPAGPAVQETSTR